MAETPDPRSLRAFRQRAGVLRASYGNAGEGEAWDQVYDHYDWDRMELAFEAASVLGVGAWGDSMNTYRLIEAEALTRRRAERERLTEALEVEFIAGELPLAKAELFSLIQTAAEEVGERFSYPHTAPVLVTLLALDADTPWTPGRHGFCADKYPYDKICLPAYLASDPDELYGAVLHEYAHVFTLNTGDARCALWLDEAIAMLACEGLEEEAIAEFKAQSIAWLDPEPLNFAFGEDREDDEGQERVWRAYQQAAVLGYYLGVLAPESQLADLLRAHQLGGFWRNLAARLTGTDPSEHALKAIYGFGTQELFRRAKAWVEADLPREPETPETRPGAST